jgi:DNA segregation ATPase FtsK/SpoIIIE, S-DNA-T family
VKTFLEKRSLKSKLNNAFSLAGLYYKVNWNGKPVRKFPTILDVRPTEKKTVYVFRLPHSVNPEDVHKKDYVFRSIFGEALEFSGERPMTLTVYHKAQFGKYAYNIVELEELMNKYNLPIVAGKNKNGEYQGYDMTKKPHLLIAGETGSGKSVMLRTILTSLIQHKRKRLVLHLADMKRSEFHLFRNVDIVQSVMTKKKDLIRCLEHLHTELFRRGDLLDEAVLSHIDDLPNPPDYIVLCIDEFSVLRKEAVALDMLQDLTALGRALGIYVILSTQRPDSEIVGGLLKSNLTVRYAFRHADKTNSRITLGDGSKEDASKIDEEDSGRFIMRYSGEHFIQAPYLDVEDAKDILATYKTPVIKRTEYEENKASGDILDQQLNELPSFDDEEESE